MKCIQQTLRTSDVQSVFLHENIGETGSVTIYLTILRLLLFHELL